MLNWQSQEESMFWGSEYYQRGSGVITEVIYRPKAFASFESFGHDDKNTSLESVVFSPRQAQARGSASTRWDAPGGNGMLFPRARRRRKRGLHHQTGGGKPNRPMEESRADANRPRPFSVPSFSPPAPFQVTKHSRYPTEYCLATCLCNGRLQMAAACSYASWR